MTFIASVIAKDGVAVIADSLVTTSEQIITTEAFFKYHKEKIENPPQNPSAMFKEIIGLFSRRKSYTKDYEEKLIVYDKYTCITFTGIASINNIKISRLIYDLIERNKKNSKSYRRKRILTKVKDFKLFIEKEAKKQLRSYGLIGDISFIITHFDKNKKKTQIYTVDINSSDKSVIKNGTEFVVYKKKYDWEKVVTDGQNNISSAILLGHLNSLPVFRKYIVPIIINNIAKELKIDQTKLTENLIQKVGYVDKIPDEIFREVKAFGLELSLQQATDLAALLMRVEMDFQKYTEDVPTVGGVIKLVTINEKGVDFISGNVILKPRNI